MLRKIAFFALILTVLFAVSCNKSKSQNTGEVVSDTEENISVTPSKWKMGYVLRVNSGLYTIDTDTGSETDIMKWAASLNLGDSVMVGEARKATFDKTVYDIVEVRDKNGKEGYSISSQVAADGKLAVVTDERAHLYKTPNTVDATGFTLSRKTVMVYYPETSSNGYVEIRAYDPEARVTRHGNYLRLSSFSENSSDIESSILLQTALALRDSVASEKARKEVLLESALLEHPNSVFYSEIYELVYPAPISQDDSLEEEDSEQGEVSNEQ